MIDASNLGHFTLGNMAEVGFNGAEFPNCFRLAQRGLPGRFIAVDDEVDTPRLAMIDPACHREVPSERARLGHRIALIKLVPR